MSTISKFLGSRSKVSVFGIIAAQDGGWSLIPMENLLRGLRNGRDVAVLELYGVNGVVRYQVRTNNGEGLSGMFRSYFPQADLQDHLREATTLGEVDQTDWLFLNEGEYASVRTLGLSREPFLPLRITDDRTIQQSGTDPLAGVIGILSNSTRAVGPAEASERLGLRVIIRPAKEDWGLGYQKKMQQRRDGEDRAARPGGPAGASGPSMSSVLALLGIGGLAYLNYYLWGQGNIPGLAAIDVLAALAAGLGIYAYRKSGIGRKRAYMDETLVEDKLKSLAYVSEVQIVRTYHNLGDEDIAEEGIESIMDCLKSLNDPAGNSWKVGPLRQYSGESIGQGDVMHPFMGGAQEMDFLDGRRAAKCILSAREVASLWHPPLGAAEMASMERTSSGNLVPYLGGLSGADSESGPVVGKPSIGDSEIRFPESSLRKHAIILGKSGVGKSTMIKHIIDYKLRRKVQGVDKDAIVVVDPHSDLVQDILRLVPPEIADKVRLLDFGRMDRVPGINLVDPHLFPDRDRCVDTIVTTVKYLWEHWGNRLEDLLKNGLLIIYEYNSHPETPRVEMLTMLDILRLLEDGVQVGQGRDARTEMSQQQAHILSRVRDPRLKQWFNSYMNWPRDVRAEAVGPVRSRVGAYASHQRASVIMGQRESTIKFSEVLEEGLVLLCATAQGSIGVQPAALMGGTIVSLVEAALRDQEKLRPEERHRCMLVCDEFQTVTGANWEGLLAEIRKYGGSLVLATQSMARLNTPDRKLKEGILGNVGVIVGYQMSAEDARIISPEMDALRVEERFLVNAHPRHCYVRVNTDNICYPSFSMLTKAPPDNSEGMQASIDAVMEASIAYTVDWQEAYDRLNAEVDQQVLSAGKFDDGGSSPGGGSSSPYPDPASVAAPTPRRARRSGAGSLDSEKGAGSPKLTSVSNVDDLKARLQEAVRGAKRPSAETDGVESPGDGYPGPSVSSPVSPDDSAGLGAVPGPSAGSSEFRPVPSDLDSPGAFPLGLEAFLPAGLVNEVSAPGPDSEVAPGPDSEVAPGPDSEVVPGLDPEVAPGPDSEVAPGPDPEVAPGPDPEVAPGVDSRAAPAPDSGVVSVEHFDPAEVAGSVPGVVAGSVPGEVASSFDSGGGGFLDPSLVAEDDDSPSYEDLFAAFQDEGPDIDLSAVDTADLKALGESIEEARSASPDEVFHEGPFRGMRKLDITNSKFPVRFLEQVVLRGKDDPALKAVLTRHLGDQEKRAWRLAEARARQEVVLDVEAERQLVRNEEVERIRDEERIKARQELGMQGVSPGLGSPAAVSEESSGDSDPVAVPAEEAPSRSGPLGRTQGGSDRPRPFHRR